MQNLKQLLFFIVFGFLIQSVAAQDTSENDVLQLGINETYKGEKNGIKLILAYNHNTSSFVCTAENITDKKLQSINIRVLLSNGSSLGPVVLTDFSVGDTRKISLSDEHQMFSWWMAHITAGGKTHQKSYSAKEENGVIHSGKRSEEDIHSGERKYEDIHSGESSTENIHDGERATDDAHTGEKSQSDIHKGEKSNKNIHEGEHSGKDLK